MAISRTLSQIPARKKLLTIAVIVAVAVVGAVSYRLFRHAPAQAQTRAARALQQVSVAAVGSLSPENAPLPVIGSVTSQDQATILAQAAGEIVALDKGIGDQVSAGEAIADIDDSAQEAAVTQAEGAYDAANAALIKASGGTQGAATVSSSAESASNTDVALSAALESAYLDLDDAVHTKTDTLFSYPQSPNPTLIQVFNIVDYYMVGSTVLVNKVESERLGLDSVLDRDNSLTLATSSADLSQNVGAMAADAQTVESFLDDLSSLVNELEVEDSAQGYIGASASTVAGYQSTVSAARTESAAAVTALSGTLNTYDTSGDQAQVEEELGALQSAKAALAKTVITSPISGTIVSLPITEGDYVSSNQEVAVISNPGALKIVAHVSAADARTLSVGNPVTIDGGAVGSISQISPAIDPTTGTVEVDVAVPGGAAGLTDGDAVTVNLGRTASAVASSASGSASIAIPIVALKITPTGPEVFTVDPQKGDLVAHPVEIGSILGANIVVTEGLTPDMQIVTDARGLTEGEIVSAKQAPVASSTPL